MQRRQSCLFVPPLLPDFPKTANERSASRCPREMCQDRAWYGQHISDLDSRNAIGDSPLHTICSWGEVESVEVLLTAGAKVNALGDRGCTPLFNAVVGGNEKVVALLLENGADPLLLSHDGR